MKVGDLVTADDYLQYVGGKLGVIIEVQGGKHCISAYVLFADQGVKLVRRENLRVVNESR